MTARFQDDRSVVVAAMRRIERRGDMGRAPKWAQETITAQDLASFGGPIPGVSAYNCFRLTERGRDFLAKATRLAS